MINNNSKSPFHKGERAIQSKLGVRDRMEKFGKMVIRDHMPEQHREFYTKLPYLIVGHADKDGKPWASILFKKQELIYSPDDKHITINTNPIEGDPLQKTLKNRANQGIQTKLGILGIELKTRRRNRLSVHVTEYSDHKIICKVDQAFGNCPKYIQAREFTFAKVINQPLMPHKSTSLDLQATKLIKNSDTFFIASYINGNIGDANKGVDVSHRGGNPGFVKVNNNILTIPDYQGNNHFNTLGNILENPIAGLLFIDYASGNILMLTGKAEIIWDSDEIKEYDGAQRLLKFTLIKAVTIKQALPFKWGTAELSRFL
jgi:predicted pyridoxine 5'-phosphate oxidase superfamily flavin-nucleotide-binding protein